MMTAGLQNRRSSVMLVRSNDILTVNTYKKDSILSNLYNAFLSNINRRNENTNTNTRSRSLRTVSVLLNKYINNELKLVNSELTINNDNNQLSKDNNLLSDKHENINNSNDSAVKLRARLNNTLNLLITRRLVMYLRRQRMSSNIRRSGSYSGRRNSGLRIHNSRSTSKNENDPERRRKRTIRTRIVSGRLNGARISTTNNGGKSRRMKIGSRQHTGRRQFISNRNGEGSQNLTSNFRLLKLRGRGRRGQRSRHNTNTTRLARRQRIGNRKINKITTNRRGLRILNLINGASKISTQLSSQKTISTSRPRRHNNYLSGSGTEVNFYDNGRQKRRFSGRLKRQGTRRITRSSVSSTTSSSNTTGKSSITRILDSNTQSLLKRLGNRVTQSARFMSPRNSRHNSVNQRRATHTRTNTVRSQGFKTIRLNNRLHSYRRRRTTLNNRRNKAIIRRFTNKRAAIRKYHRILNDNTNGRSTRSTRNRIMRLITPISRQLKRHSTSCTKGNNGRRGSQENRSGKRTPGRSILSNLRMCIPQSLLGRQLVLFRRFCSNIRETPLLLSTQYV